MTTTTYAPSEAPQIKLVLTAALVAFLAQAILNPIIDPLSREVGLAEWQVGVTISVAAVMMVFAAQAWGRRSKSVGRKRILVAALALGTVATAAFALVSNFAVVGVLTGTTALVLSLLLRIDFGTAIAAIEPTAQDYIADVPPEEKNRVKEIPGVGAVQGIAQVTGSFDGAATMAIVTRFVLIHPRFRPHSQP